MSALDYARFYKFIRLLLFCFDPETGHYLSLAALRSGMAGKAAGEDDPLLQTDVAGLRFSNPIGLAAGYDKQAEVMRAVLRLGFGFTEVGSITPLPQPGNPKPRLFRVVDAEAVINRFGFNSDGFDVCLERVKKYRTENQKISGIVGINIGKNKESADATADYVKGVSVFGPYADYLTVNLSSPNTPGLRDLQGRAVMLNLLTKVIEARNSGTKKPPVFVKIAPDLSDARVEDIADVVLASGVDGVIVGNTTVTRPAGIPAKIAAEAGGLSGKPLFDLSTQILTRLYKRTQGKVPLIGCGGVSSGEDAYAKIKAGASLVQLYTALVYQGPGLVQRIKRDLAMLLKRDGFESVGEAVGMNKV